MFIELNILLLLLFGRFSQFEHNILPTTSKFAWNNIQASDKTGNQDSTIVKISFHKNDFNLIDSTKFFSVIFDTVKLVDGSFAIGKKIVDPYLEFHDIRIGDWASYYSSGKIYAKGNYSIGAYTECQSGGPSIIAYNFKVGDWKYWYENGALIAEGNYETPLVEKKTNCGIDTVIISNFTSEWKYYEPSGVEAINNIEIISLINNNR